MKRDRFASNSSRRNKTRRSRVGDDHYGDDVSDDDGDNNGVGVGVDDDDRTVVDDDDYGDDIDHDDNDDEELSRIVRLVMMMMMMMMRGRGIWILTISQRHRVVKEPAGVGREHDDANCHKYMDIRYTCIYTSLLSRI